MIGFLQHLEILHSRVIGCAVSLAILMANNYQILMLMRFKRTFKNLKTYVLLIGKKIVTNIPKYFLHILLQVIINLQK